MVISVAGARLTEVGTGVLYICQHRAFYYL